MPSLLVSELSTAVNAEARLQFPKVARLLGASSLATRIAPRFSLRRETSYPYSFTEDDHLAPSDGENFGRVIRRSRRDGLEEIHTSIHTDTKEHSWLFIPSEMIWLDTTLEAHASSVVRDQYAHIFLSHLFPKIEAVHTHPDATVRKLAEDEPWGYSNNYLLEAAQPSGNDIIAHCQMIARTAPDSRQVSTIVSHYGATSFSLTGNTGNGLRTEQYDRLIKDSSRPLDAIHNVLGRMSTHILDGDNTPALRVEFEPL